MGLSRTIRFAAAAASISLVAGPAAFAAPPPSAAAATAAQMQSAPLASADLATRLAAQRQALAQQTAQRHQAQLQAIKAALASGAQPLGALRPGVRSLAPGIAPMGTVVAKSLTFAPPIAIQQLSATEGDPGTPVLLTGAGFGDTAGEVHFVVANGRDLKATSPIWSNGQIMAEVPYLDGVNAYDGIVYVQHVDGRKSAFSNFRYRPPLDVVVLGMPECLTKLDVGHGPSCVQYRDSSVSLQADNFSGSDAIDHWSMVASFNADDVFWKTNTLKNGWIVSSCDIIEFPGVYLGTATVSECRSGTNSPFTKVHWWIDWASKHPSDIRYAPRVTITGPKGLPYF
jgi:hypothetical protein